METNKLVEAIVFAGPNGSGKSTITKFLRPIGIDYINADDIKRVLNCTDLEAAEYAERQREDYLKKGKNFCFETVLSTDRNFIVLLLVWKDAILVVPYIVGSLKFVIIFITMKKKLSLQQQ